VPDPEDAAAIRAWNALNNGMGGIDWAGLPMVCAMLEVENVETLVERMLVIKGHKPPKDDDKSEE
jgi:hypothetical protein